MGIRHTPKPYPVRQTYAPAASGGFVAFSVGDDTGRALGPAARLRRQRRAERDARLAAASGAPLTPIERRGLFILAALALAGVALSFGAAYVATVYPLHVIAALAVLCVLKFVSQP